MICMLVRDFATTQERRLSKLNDVTLVLYEAGAYRPKVLAPDSQARRVGVNVGDWFGQARAVCPDAVFLPVDETRYQRIYEDITRRLLTITDRIEPEYQATSAAWYTDDALMLPYLLETIQNTTGIVPQVGIAMTKFPTRVAAAVADPGEQLIIPNGDEVVFLAPYPVTLLPLDKKMQRRLPLLGLDTLGQLAALPRIAVWEQFGKHGRWLHDLANGKDIRPLMPAKPPLMLAASHEVDDPIRERALLNHLLERFSLSLIDDLAGREAHQLTLLVTLEDGTLLDSHRQPHEPIRDGLYLLRLLSQMLDRLPISDAVTSMEVRIGDVRERLPRQLSLFDERKPAQSLYDVAPGWAGRYRAADFYRLALTGATLPETAIEKRQIKGA